MKLCEFEGCENKSVSKGLCNGHYKQSYDGRELRPLLKRARPGEFGNVCSFPECSNPHAAVGLCISHYAQKNVHNLNELRPIANRARRGELIPWIETMILSAGDECITWPFGLSNGIPGNIRFGEIGTVRVTTAVLEISGFPRPENLYALHSCDNQMCVNPNHLRWGTAKDNAEDRDTRGRHAWQRHEKLIAWLDEQGIQFPDQMR